MFLRKSIFGTASMVGLAGVLALSGCSSDANTNSDGIANDDKTTGSIGLNLQLADGSDVDVVSFIVTRGGQTVRTGTLSIGADGLASGTISGLDAGGGYSIALTAPRTRDGGTASDCTGAAEFTVIASQTVTVGVVLQCDDSSADVGNVTINGTFNICPKISVATATPTTQAVGSSIALSVTANDKNSDALTYSWFTGATYSAASTFATGATASYTCAAAGTYEINVSVYDGDARGCRKQLTTALTVTCTGASTDGGVPEVDSGEPEVDSGEPQVDSGEPQVDSGMPVRFGTATCDDCVTSSCTLYQDYAPLLPNCVDAACEASFACFQRNKCSTDLASVNKCYCGQVSNEDCLVTGYVATGPCATLANTTFGSTNAQVVLGLLYAEDTGFGDGAALFSCAADLCTSQCVTASDIPAP